MSKVYLEDSVLTDIADAIREKTGESGTITPADMPSEIESISGGGGGVTQPLVMTEIKEYTPPTGVDGFSKVTPQLILEIPSLGYIFKNTTKNRYFNTVLKLTNDLRITHQAETEYFCDYSNVDLSTVTIDLTNLGTYLKLTQWSYMFGNLGQNFVFPKLLFTSENINTDTIRNASSQRLFQGSYYLEDLPSDWLSFFNTILDKYIEEGKGFGFASFYDCFNFLNDDLRNKAIKTVSKGQHNYSGIKDMVNNNLLMDKLIIPAIYASGSSPISLNMSLMYIRGKDKVIFENFDTSSDFYKYSTSTIDLQYVGLGVCRDNVSEYYGIPVIRSQETYEQYKNSRKATVSMNNGKYSFYNHDRAVETINSLPDMTLNKQANQIMTIKFKGATGSATEGGAINTLTEEEIAVASDRGWTVSLV